MTGADNEQDSEDDDLRETLTGIQIEKGQAVDLIGNLVGMLGTMGGSRPVVQMPKAGAAPKKKEQKNIQHIRESLEQVSIDESLNGLMQDEHFMQWLERQDCKLKNFQDELKFTRQTIDLAAEYKQYEFGILACKKALAITRLHALKDTELLSQLYWVKAEFHAYSGNLNEGYACLKQCVSLVDPDADENSDAYKELAKELEDSHAKAVQSQSPLTH